MGDKGLKRTREQRSVTNSPGGRSDEANNDFLQDRAGRSRRRVGDNTSQGKSGRSSREREVSQGRSREESRESSMERWLDQQTPQSRESSVERGLARSEAHIQENAYFAKRWPEVEGKEQELDQALNQELERQEGRLANLHETLLELSKSQKLPEQRQKTIRGAGKMLENISKKSLPKTLDTYDNSEALEKIDATRNDYTDPSSAIGLDRQAILNKLESARTSDASLTNKADILSKARHFIRADRADINRQAQMHEEELHKDFDNVRSKLISQAEVYAGQYQTHIDRTRGEIGEDEKK
jgi:hypothetical protein